MLVEIAGWRKGDEEVEEEQRVQGIGGGFLWEGFGHGCVLSIEDLSRLLIWDEVGGYLKASTCLTVLGDCLFGC